MQGIPSLKVVYEDQLITCYIHDVKEDGSLLVFHADVLPTTRLSIIRHYQNVVESIFEHLRSKGVKSIEAWVNTDKQFNYAMFFGFTEDVGELLLNGQSAFPPVYRVRANL